MNARSYALLGSLLVGSLAATGIACSSSNSSTGSSPDGGSSGGSGSGGSGGGSSGSGSGSSGSGGSGSGSSSGGSGGSGSGSSSGGGGSGSGSGSGGTTDGGSSGGPPFAAGTICNASATALTPPATLKNLIVIMLENENYGSVNGAAAAAPYINSLASQCGVATAYNDNCFNNDNLVSQPHYMALTSGSNCDTGNDQTGTNCITSDETEANGTVAGEITLSTTSIFQQAASWKSYQEEMPSACDTSTPATGNYAAKHNPAVFYTNLTSTSSCTDNDLPLASVTCSSTTMTACGTPSNAFTEDLANDTLAAFTLVTPNLVNDMHNGSPPANITMADNWLYTYLPLVFKSAAYLRGDVALFLIWDEQDTLDVGGPIPNVFISPYIKAGTVTATPMNHYSVLRSFEEALGISTFLGCASGTQPGDAGACPSGSTAEVRAALNF